MLSVLAVFVGGGLGAAARYGVTLAFRRLWPHAALPWGTFAVNVAGCLALGLLAVVLADRVVVSPAARLGLTTGFLGGLTTFSTFGQETVGLLAGETPTLGLLNVALNVLVGLAAAGAGMWLGGRWPT
ncbi:MAG: fluoride efflux transporter CrcB [Myxococcales bacterium]|nr:fluoride efflux transporter CrcB [Myxococcales bacterium]